MRKKSPLIFVSFFLANWENLRSISKIGNQSTINHGKVPARFCKLPTYEIYIAKLGRYFSNFYYQSQYKCISVKKVNYRVEVKTSDKFGAGTDANVKMKLTGSNGLSKIANTTYSHFFYKLICCCCYS